MGFLFLSNLTNKNIMLEYIKNKYVMYTYIIIKN
jgi:hypothetical protein